MKQFAEEYPDFPFVQVPLAQIQEMPILQARLAKFTISATIRGTGTLIHAKELYQLKSLVT
jgi:hypothetical protein